MNTRIAFVAGHNRVPRGRVMEAKVCVFLLFSLLSFGTAAPVAGSVFFEEQFNGPNLDFATWRTEILTSGPRWCDTRPGWVWEGSWVEEGSPCYGVAAHSPYGTAPISDGLLHISPTYGLACPYLVSRLPGPVQLFPSMGDFTLKIRMRYDRVTGYGDGVFVEQQDSTEPSGVNPPSVRLNILMQLWGTQLQTSLGGSHQTVAPMPPPGEMHEFGLECVGSSYTISIDGQVVYGPVNSTLRPTAVWIGHPALAYWGWSDWTSFSVDYIRVEVPGPATGACCFPSGGCLVGTEADCQTAGGIYVGDGVPCDPYPCGPTPINKVTWGQVKSLYR